MIGVIPCAGKGTRFKELGKHYSKTILPYKETPILIHQINWLENQGCNDIRIVINHQQDSIKNILKLYNKEVKIFHQFEMNGLSGAIECALSTHDKDSILIVLGDLVVQDNIASANFEYNFVGVKRVPDYSRWCMVKYVTANNSKNTNSNLQFFDKPKEKPPTPLALSGVYYFKENSNIYNALQHQTQDLNAKIAGEFQLSTALAVLNQEEPMNLVFLDLIDFGTLEEYLQNRGVKNSRSFNEITINNNLVTKGSERQREKIIKEVNWFRNLPDEIKIFTPRILSCDFFDDNSSYTMEKILAPSLREIYLFLDSSVETWEGIFNSAFSLLETMETYGQENTFCDFIVKKTNERIKDIYIDKDLRFIYDFIHDLTNSVTDFSRPTLMHGDFCFSNLLYDFQSSTIKMIDPRGELFGDHYYEVAKLVHSVLFDYDFVDAELYIKSNDKFTLLNNGKEPIKDLFVEMIKLRYTPDEHRHIMMLSASLFLSMIPLHSHSENNQQIYYNTFVKIYKSILKTDVN